MGENDEAEDGKVRVFATPQVNDIEKALDSHEMIHVPVDFGGEACIGAMMVYDDRETAMRKSVDGSVITMEMDEHRYQQLVQDE